MNSLLVDIAFDFASSPEESLCGLLKAVLAITNSNRGVILALDRSDRDPLYRRVVRESPTEVYTEFLNNSSHIQITNLNMNRSPQTFSSDEIRNFGAGWYDFFHGSALAIPIPGRPLCVEPVEEEHKVFCYAGVIIVGPIESLLKKNHHENQSIEKSSILATIACLASSYLERYDREKAMELLCLDSIFDTKDDVDKWTADRLGEYILDVVKQTIPFEVGSLYLRDLEPGKDRYLVFASARGEDKEYLLKSYWTQKDKGVTWRTMNTLKPAGGTRIDLKPIGARETNTKALSHAMPEKTVNDAWALVPFVTGDEPIAVAHLEGVNYGAGLTRAQYEALKIQGKLLGQTIHQWRNATNHIQELRPDVNLVGTLCQLFSSFNKINAIAEFPSNKEYEFENLVRQAFKDNKDTSDVTHTCKKIIKEQFARDLKFDCVLKLEGTDRKCVLEITFKNDTSQNADLDKLRQLSEYMDYVKDSVGILVVGGQYAIDKKGAGHINKRIWIMDLSRLERFFCLAPKSRIMLMKRWLEHVEPGIEYCNFDH